MALFRRRRTSRRVTGGGSWLAYPTLTHGNAGMVKLAGANHHRSEVAAALRRFGPLVLAELRIEQAGQWAGAERVYVRDLQVASVPAVIAQDYRDVVELLARAGQRATIHAELELDTHVDVWGLCKPQPREPDEPLLPTQYREDVQLVAGVAAELDTSLHSRAKENKVRRTGLLTLNRDGI